jgi:hypothetical protein
MPERPVHVDALDAHAISIIAQSSDRSKTFRVLEQELSEARANPETRHAADKTISLIKAVFPELNG